MELKIINDTKSILNVDWGRHQKNLMMIEQLNKLVFKTFIR